MTLPTGIPLLTKPAAEYLNERQRIDYTEHRKDFLEWLSVFGKDPQHVERCYRLVLSKKEMVPEMAEKPIQTESPTGAHPPLPSGTEKPITWEKGQTHT